MISFEPNIFIERLVAYSNGISVYDERFHRGLNVIRGENSSGKSTIMDFLFYGLGGDVTQWRGAALRCNAIYLQAQFNGITITLSRDVMEQSQRPMRVFIGSLDDAIKSAEDGWEIYPYARGNKESFSQVLFRYLNLPDVQLGEGHSKITMNQILRLIYVNQLSSINRIFLDQNFDDSITRQTVSDLICGAYSDVYYSSVIEKAKIEKELTDVKAKIKSIHDLHKNDPHPLTREWLDSERKLIEQRVDLLKKRILQIDSEKDLIDNKNKITIKAQNNEFKKIIELQNKISKISSSIEEMIFDINDSKQFIDTLSKRIEQLYQSKKVSENMGLIAFEFCPSCRAPIDSHPIEGACSLCKSPFDVERLKDRCLKLIDELTRQREQSTELQSEREVRLVELQADLSQCSQQWKHATKNYRILVDAANSENTIELANSNRELGSLEQQSCNLDVREKTIDYLEYYTSIRNVLQKEFDEKTIIIESEENRKVDRIDRAYSIIKKKTVEFLKRDFSRQDFFENPDNFEFSFERDTLHINNEKIFSASSTVYLKNSFMAALLFSACVDKEFGHPRLMIMDTIEDKGMEVGRSHNFQNLLKEYSENAVSEHQLIIATSAISAELDSDKFTVGQFYTHTNKTLNLL